MARGFQNLGIIHQACYSLLEFDIVSSSRKFHNYTLQIKPRHSEEETQNKAGCFALVVFLLPCDSKKTTKAKQPALSSLGRCTGLDKQFF